MSNDEQAIRTWLNDWLRTSAKGDSQTMLAMLTDDMVFLVPGQPPFGKKEFKAAWDGPMKGPRLESKADRGVHRERKYGMHAYTAGRRHHHARWDSLPSERLHAQLLPQAARWLLAARDANLLTPET